MIIIQELSEMIEEEIEDASKYAKCAITNKDSNSALADVFYKLSNEELNHASMLHSQVVAIIDAYRKTNGEPPEPMLTLYEVFHKKHIANTAMVKGILSLYKELGAK